MIKLTTPMLEAGAEMLYGATRAKARAAAKEEKFDGYVEQARDIFEAMIQANPHSHIGEDSTASVSFGRWLDDVKEKFPDARISGFASFKAEKAGQSIASFDFSYGIAGTSL
jgi:hypothetical protein